MCFLHRFSETGDFSQFAQAQTVADGPCKALNNGMADVAGAAVNGWINSPGHERRR